VGLRGEPFQLTTDAASKFVPVTVRLKPVALQYGVEVCESEVTVGVCPSAVLIVKLKMFDNSVVVVAPVLEVGETDEPGIWMATGIFTGAVVPLGKLEAGTTAVMVVLVNVMGVSAI